MKIKIKCQDVPYEVDLTDDPEVPSIIYAGPGMENQPVHDKNGATFSGVIEGAMLALRVLKARDVPLGDGDIEAVAERAIERAQEALEDPEAEYGGEDDEDEG